MVLCKQPRNGEGSTRILLKRQPVQVLGPGNGIKKMLRRFISAQINCVYCAWVLSVFFSVPPVGVFLACYNINAESLWWVCGAFGWKYCGDGFAKVLRKGEWKDVYKTFATPLWRVSNSVSWLSDLYSKIWHCTFVNAWHI